MPMVPCSETDNGRINDRTDGHNDSHSILPSQQQVSITEPTPMQRIQHSTPSPTIPPSPSESTRRSVPISSLLMGQYDSPPGRTSLIRPETRILPPFTSLPSQHDPLFGHSSHWRENTGGGMGSPFLSNVPGGMNDPYPHSTHAEGMSQRSAEQRSGGLIQGQSRPYNLNQSPDTSWIQNPSSRETEEPQDALMMVSQQSATSRFGSTALPPSQYADNSRTQTWQHLQPIPQHIESSARMNQPPSLVYELKLRQHPAAARACGYGERDRRVVDPPPILELHIRDPTTLELAHDPTATLALQCGLLSSNCPETNSQAAAAIYESNLSRQLIGTLMASPHYGNDETGAEGVFFVFPDLSCRLQGRFRLRFKLIRIDHSLLAPGAAHPCVASAISEVFTVYTAKTFPGMRGSSALLRALRSQGLNVGLRKGTGQRLNSQVEDQESDSDESNENEHEHDRMIDFKGEGSASMYTGDDRGQEHRESENPRVNKRRKTVSSQDQPDR